jgi:hypothetical protein
MKKTLLLKTIKKYGAIFVRHGKKHDIYQNLRTGEFEQIPRHSDIEENLARDIIKTFRC